MPRVSVTNNDLEALKAAFSGVRTTASRLLQMEAAVNALQPQVDANRPSDAGPEPPAELRRAASAHAVAAAAFDGLLRRLFAPAPAAPAPVELTDSAAENA
jgi:hypothetical protein